MGCQSRPKGAALLQNASATVILIRTLFFFLFAHLIAVTQPHPYTPYPCLNKSQFIRFCLEMVFATRLIILFRLRLGSLFLVMVWYWGRGTEKGKGVMLCFMPWVRNVVRMDALLSTHKLCRMCDFSLSYLKGMRRRQTRRVLSRYLNAKIFFRRNIARLTGF